MTDSGCEDVKRSECGTRVANTRNQTNQGIETKAPAEDRHSEQVVQKPSQTLGVLIDC